MMKLKDYRLAVFDMDGVLTQPVSSWEYVHRKLGVDNTYNLDSYRAGTLSYIDFLKSDVELWLHKNGKTSAEQIIRILNEIPMRNGINSTIVALRESGLKTAIISGGIYWLAEKIGKSAQIDEVHANRILTDDSNYILADGLVMVDPKHKDTVIRDIQVRLGVNKNETISVGDTFQDVAMFRNSGLGIAFNPVDETVSEKASHTIYGNDLSAILDIID